MKWESPNSYRLTLTAGNHTIREVPQAGWVQTAPVAGGRLFVARSTSNLPTIYELNPTTGAVLNSFPAPAPAQVVGPQGLALGPSSLFYIDGTGTQPHTLFELNPATGAIIDSDVTERRMESVKLGMTSRPSRVTWKWFIAPASSMYVSVVSR